MPKTERAPHDTAARRAGIGLPQGARRIRMVLGRSPHSRAMPGEVLDHLAGLGHIERYRGGELIHAAWQPVRKLWLVLSGGVRVSELDPDGTALITAVLGEGSYFAAGSLVKPGMLVKAEAHAVGRTQVAAFDLEQLERDLGPIESVQQHRRLLIYQRLWAFSDLYRDALIVALPQRLARRLLSMAQAAGREPEIELQLAQTDLASMLGASRSRVNAELRRLETEGVVRLEYRRIVVRDLQRLRVAAGADVVTL